MGFWRKEEEIHFERDEEGRVIRTKRTGDVARTPVSDALLKQQKTQKKPNRFIGIGKKIDKAVVRYNRRQPRRGYSVHNNYNPFGSMFDSGMGYSSPRKKKTSGKKSKKGKPRSVRNYGFDSFDQWGFFR